MLRVPCLLVKQPGRLFLFFGEMVLFVNVGKAIWL